MIKWSIKNANADIFVIDIVGHAGYAKRGHDIVCASVSTSFYFFVNCIEKVDQTSIKNLVINDGDVNLQLNISKKTKPLLEVFQLMMKEIENQYPSYLMEVKSND